MTAAWLEHYTIGGNESNRNGLISSASCRFVHGKMQVGQCGVPGIPGQADLLSGFNLITDLNQCAVLLQVVILTGCSVVMHDDYEIRILPATIVPASFVVGLLDARNDTIPGGVNRCADIHSEIDCILLGSAVAKS